MKISRGSRAIVLVALLAGVLLVLGLCAGPVSSPDRGPEDRGTRDRSVRPPVASTHEPDSTEDAEVAPANDREPERRVALEVRVQDGPSGRPVEARAVTVRVNYQNRKPIPLRRVGSVFRLDSMKPPDWAGATIFVSVTPPPGLVPETLETTFDTEISEAAETLVATVVVWPEYRLRVEVWDRDGVLVPDAVVVAHDSGPWRCRKIDFKETTDIGGTVRFTGLPLIPDEPIIIRADRADAGAITTVIPTRPGSERLVRLVLPASFGGRPREDEPEEGGSIEAGMIDNMTDSLDDDPPPVESEEPPETRAIDIRVVDERGQPVPSARIWIDPWNLEGTTQLLRPRTDAAGRLVLEGVPRSGHAIGASLGTRHAQDWLEGTEDRMTLTIRRQPLTGGDTNPVPDGEPGTRLVLKEGFPTDIRGYVTSVEWGPGFRISVGRSAGVWNGLELDVIRVENGVETRIGKVYVRYPIGENWACAGLSTHSRQPRRGDRVVWRR
jgi:hypothetical protein